MAAPAEKLVPVHDEPGAVQFKYNTSYVALGGGLALGGGGGGGANGAAAAEPLSVWEERPQAAEPAKLPPPLEDLDDFISLEEAAPAAQVGGWRELAAGWWRRGLVAVIKSCAAVAGCNRNAICSILTSVGCRRRACGGRSSSSSSSGGSGGSGSSRRRCRKPAGRLCVVRHSGGPGSRRQQESSGSGPQPAAGAAAVRALDGSAEGHPLPAAAPAPGWVLVCGTRWLLQRRGCRCWI